MPKLTEIPGIENWKGYQIHSHNYQVPDPFKGQVLVMIGLEASGFDISKHVGKVAKEIHIATRINKRFPNIKLQDFQNITHHSTIKCVYEDGLAVFEDGSSVYADSIIHCTGYIYDFPFLYTKGIVNVEERRVGPLYKHAFPPPLAPSLLTSLDSSFLLGELQRKVELPSEEEMMNSVQDYYQFMQQNQIPKHLTHILCPHQVEYKHWLAEQSGLGPLEEWMDKMFRECFHKILEMDHFYMNHWDDAYWDSIIHPKSNT